MNNEQCDKILKILRLHNVQINESLKSLYNLLIMHTGNIKLYLDHESHDDSEKYQITQKLILHKDGLIKTIHDDVINNSCDILHQLFFLQEMFELADLVDTEAKQQ